MADNRRESTSTARRRASQIRSGVSKLFGFSLSTLLLAVASILVIPAMVAASGEVAWGAIALGQSIGAIGGLAVGYGWGVLGPARIAGTTPTDRRAEYVESVLAKLLLLVPVSAVTALFAFFVAPGSPLLAAAGAIATTTVGLTAVWYYIGTVQPYALFCLETIPRTAGTAVGILLMHLGHSALVGVICMFLGMVVAFVMSTGFVLWTTGREGSEPVRPRPMWTILASNRHAVASSLGATIYAAAPIVIVSTVAPAIQPTFALADKLRNQIYAALIPAGTVLQGWVPRVRGAARAQRAHTALLVSSGFAVVLGVASLLVCPALVNWLGHHKITVSMTLLALMSATISASFLEWVIEHVVLASFERIRVAALAVLVSWVTGLPLVAVGAWIWGASGAMLGVLVGPVVCIIIEYIDYLRTIKPLTRSPGAGCLPPHLNAPSDNSEAVLQPPDSTGGAGLGPADA